MLLLQLLLPAVSLLSSDAARAATRRWIDRMVIGQRLCPWAAPAAVRIVIGQGEALDMLGHEAALLRTATEPLSTTLIVFLEESLAEPASFGRLYREARRQVRSDIDLLAFHPTRVDSGPGCVTDNASDAGHYSVRSPLPTLQLLRTEDLVASRRHFEAHAVPGAAVARARHPRAPGALALLLENKRRLRSLGTRALQRLLDNCRDSDDLDSLEC